MNDRVRYTFTDGVADVKLSRADKMNALDDAMFSGLIETGEALCMLPGLRAVVLSGEGRAFCAGLDMGRFQGMASQAASDKPRDTMRLRARTHGIANRAQQSALVWQQVPVPVIAAVHGAALGGGFQIAIGADIRLVTADVKMSVLEIKWGLVPDLGGLFLMRSLARADVIRELTYTGRIFNGAEAVALGFATRVCADPYAEAMAMARDIAQKNPEAIRADKRLLALAEHGSAAEILQAESDEQSLVMGRPNQVEAVKAALEKRAPRFVD